MTPISAALVASGRTIGEPRLSPDGQSVVFASRGVGGPQLVRVDLGDGPDVVLGPETVLTVDPPPIGVHPSGGGSYDWLPDSSALVYAARDGVYLLPRAGGLGVRLFGPVAEGASLSQPAVSPDLRWVAAVEERDDHCAVVVAGLLDGSAAVLHRGANGSSELDDVATGLPAESSSALRSALEVGRAAFIGDPTWGRASQLLWHEWTPPAMAWDDSSIIGVVVGSVDGVVRATQTRRWLDGGRVGRGQPRFSPDGSTLAWVEDSSGFMNVHVGPISGPGRAVVAELHEHATPTWGPGQRSFCWAPNGKQIAYVRNEKGFARLCVADCERTEPHVAIELGKAWHLGLSWAKTSKGTDRIAAVRTGGKTPPQLVVYSLGASVKRVTVARSAVGAWDVLDLVEPSVLHWSAEDGTTLHGRIYRPQVRAGSTHLIVSLHGGPTDQSTVQFNERFQYWLARGWSILVPDYRGSTGWGRAYQQALNGRWGELDIADAASAIRFAIANGWAGPETTVAMGGSAGGLTVLGLLAFHPELVAAGVALYPVTDLIDLDERTHRFEKHYNAVLVGQRPGSDARYVDRSPISYASRIARPLLLLHGDADDTVPVGQSIALRDKLRDLGRPVDMKVYEGEGHGWRFPATKLDELATTGAFFSQHGLDPA